MSAEAPGQRMVNADVQINPPDFVSDNPNWVSILGWQGHLENQRGQVVDNLEKVGPATTAPPKPSRCGAPGRRCCGCTTERRWPRCRSILAADPGIGAKEVPARRRSPGRSLPRSRSCSGSATPTPQRAVDDRLPGGAVLHAGLIGGLSWGAGGSTAARPLAARPNSADGAGVIGQPHVEILAHHGLLLAIPAFAPRGCRGGCGDLCGDAGPGARARTLKVRTWRRRAKMVHRDNFPDPCDCDGRRPHHRRMWRIEQLR
jgi:hypothetical protein